MVFCSMIIEILFFLHQKITVQDKMDSKKADEDLDESEEDEIDFEEDENDSALESSTGCESRS